MKLHILVNLMLLVGIFANPNRYGVKDEQNECLLQWSWNLFSYPLRARYGRIVCNKISKDDMLKIEQEERRRQIFKDRIEAQLTASSIFRDFYSGRYKKSLNYKDDMNSKYFT
jgi:hypothetical protein